MDLRHVLGLNVRRIRTAAGLSQEDLAHSAAIHVTYLSGIENGKRNATVLVIERLAGGLGVPPEELLQRHLT
jgi:transcriptional regulator with XRE-family HTH domain